MIMHKKRIQRQLGQSQYYISGYMKNPFQVKRMHISP